jgi:two-component system phosphate regulon sensor histidine kinase PhoR
MQKADNEVRAREDEAEIQRQACRDALQRLQTALAQAENHLEELKDPTAKSWSLRESAEEIVMAIEMAGTVLQNLLRDEYLPGEYHFAPLDLRAIVASAVALAEPLAARRNLRLGLSLTPDHMPISLPASPIHLQQAFRNLLHNAVVYSRRAGEPGASGPPPGDGCVTIHGAYADQGYRITIENFGPGICEEEYERIFEAGYKGELRLRERGTGAGLGLALTKQVIEKHRGWIRVQSKPAGEPAADASRPYLTRFTIWLPLTQPTTTGPAIRLVK